MKYLMLFAIVGCSSILERKHNDFTCTFFTPHGIMGISKHVGVNYTLEELRIQASKYVDGSNMLAECREGL